jgi:DNA-directed RNA polymerase subunit RPC12/RpoP
LEVIRLQKIGKGKELSMKTSKNWQVFEVLGELESLLYRCPACGERIEVLADELNKKHICPKCGKQFDSMKRPYHLYGRGRTAAAR